MIYLDFDGVLFDTVQEAYIISKLALDKSAVIDDKDEYEQFLDMRSSVMSAWNYEPIMEGLSLGLKGLELNTYVNKKILLGRSAKTNDFERKFFKRREEFHMDNYQAWLKLSKPFPFWSLVLPLIFENLDKFAILSTRDEISINELLTYYGGPKIKILGRNAYISAGNSKAKLIKNFSLKHEQSIWVDDNLEHLNEIKNSIDCRQSRIKTVWATWGYVKSADQFDNTDNVIKVIKKSLEPKKRIMKII